MENQEPDEDRSRDDSHLEVGPFVYQSRNSSDSDPHEAPHTVTGVQGVIRYCPHMVKGLQEEIPYCYLGTSSGKQKTAVSPSEPQFCSDNTPATNEADQILFALQQLANNSNSSNVNNNINRVSKLLKPPTTTIPTFDGKSEKFELFELLFQTKSKIHNQLTDQDKKTTSTLSCVVMRCRRSTTSAAQSERIW